MLNCRFSSIEAAALLLLLKHPLPAAVSTLCAWQAPVSQNRQPTEPRPPPELGSLLSQPPALSYGAVQLPLGHVYSIGQLLLLQGPLAAAVASSVDPSHAGTHHLCLH